MQSTLETSICFTGTGLHTGRPVRLRVCPAPANHGIVLRRLDVPAAVADVPALWDRVIVSPLNTRVQNRHGTSVSTIEHLMAALAGCGVHNALVEMSGPEVPILDGSAAPFVRGIVRSGIRRLDAPLYVIEVTATVTVTSNGATARFEPSAELTMRFDIDFPDLAIGRQGLGLSLANGAFVRELCDSRTFCRRADVDRMQAAGLALGGSYDNAVVVDGARVLTPGGLRHKDEAVRHKMLDALGDLYTAGAPILAHYTGNRAGHAVTNALLSALFHRPDAWRLRLCDARTAMRLPGAGLAAHDLAAVA